MLIAVSIFMIIAGVGLFVISSLLVFRTKQVQDEINSSTKVSDRRRVINISGGYLVAISLLAGAACLYLNYRWGLHISLFSLLALVYFSLKNFNWQSSEKNVLGYGLPLIIGFIGGAISIIILIQTFK